METWDIAMGMCMPIPMGNMPMRMLMVRGNAFGVGVEETGPRGRSAIASPNMVMADLGTSIGAIHYVNLDFMGTIERWTIPYSGYPELLQIGEASSNGVLFLDGQHPHNSPVMGLTLSDTIRFDENRENNLKLFFAPRGESTDGPIAFMHRVTGMVNPDAPLGHHVGQDVGHISSTVLGASLKAGGFQFEASTFNGTEPEPDAIDLPLGKLNSFSLRLIKEFSPSLTAMASIAFVRNPEPDDATITSLCRYSASIYFQHSISEEWKFYNAFIFGDITKYDYASELASFGEEFLFSGEHSKYWGRLEILQRTPAELEIETAGLPNDGVWVGALTLGYTRALAHWSLLELGVGGSLTMDFIPNAFSSAYGSATPLAAKAFFQLSGMKMWDL
jgi:hypothetical protein